MPVVPKGGGAPKAVPTAPAPSLVEPNEPLQLIQKLDDRYGKLNNLWCRAEDQLRQFLVPCEVSFIIHAYWDDDEHPQSESYHHLGWTKYCGVWRICFGYSSNHDPSSEVISWKPVTDSTVDIRVNCVAHFAKLKELLIAKGEDTISQLDAAIGKLTLAIND